MASGGGVGAAASRELVSATEVDGLSFVSMKKRARWERKHLKKEESERGEWSRCMHFFPGKNRHCNIPRRGPGSLYCGHHDTASASERLPCPVDPSHEVWRRDLAGHVSRCAALRQERQREQLPYYQIGVCKGSASAEEASQLQAYREALALALQHQQQHKQQQGHGNKKLVGEEARVVDEEEEEEQEQEEQEDGAEEGAPEGVFRAGSLAALCRGPNSMMVHVPSLCIKLLRWAHGSGRSHCAFPQDAAVFHPATLPGLRTALAHTAGGGGGGGGESGGAGISSSSAAAAAGAAATTTPGAGCEGFPSPAEAATGERVLSSATRHTAFRHELQQASIVSSLLWSLCGGHGGEEEGGAPPAPPSASGASSGCFGGRVLPAGAPLPASSQAPLFVEFGAGRGKLSLTLETMLRGAGVEDRRLLLIERSRVGRKADKEVRRAAGTGGDSTGSAGGSKMQRVRLDIGDCALKELLSCFHPEGGGVVGMGKHLCGAATDLTLRSIVQAFQAPPGAGEGGGGGGGGGGGSGESIKQQHVFWGLGIALCCHHACNWEDYVGKDFWREAEGFAGTAVEFEACKLLSSWALLEEDRGVTPNPPTASGLLCALQHPRLSLEGLQDHAAWVLGLPTHLKAAIGRAAKRAIDAGRLRYLDGAFQEGGRARLQNYCTRACSLENTLLLFTPMR
jgi:hypothetical protein